MLLEEELLGTNPERIKEYQELDTTLHAKGMILGDKVLFETFPTRENRVDLIYEHYKNIKIAFLFRDPRDYIFIKEDRQFRGIEFSLLRWMQLVENALNLKKEKPEDIIFIKYEGLVLDTVETLKRICNFLKIQYDENMLTFEMPMKEYRNRYGNSISKERIGVWKKEPNEKCLDFVIQQTKELAKKVGYDF